MHHAYPIQAFQRHLLFHLQGWKQTPLGQPKEKIKSKALKKVQAIQNTERPPSQDISSTTLKQFTTEFLSLAKRVYAAGNVEIYEKSLKVCRVAYWQPHLRDSVDEVW